MRFSLALPALVGAALALAPVTTRLTPAGLLVPLCGGHGGMTLPIPGKSPAPDTACHAACLSRRLLPGEDGES